MVKKHGYIFFISCVLIALLLTTCSFFRTTPFPDDLVYLESYTSCREYITTILPKDRYNIFMVNNYLFLTAVEESRHVVYVFDTNLTFMGEYNGLFYDTHFSAADGSIIVGDRSFAPDISSESTNSLNWSTGNYGFSYGDYNFKVRYEGGSNLLKYTVYNSAFGAPTSAPDIDLPSYYESLEKLVYDPGSSGEISSGAFVVLFFRIKNNSGGEALRVPAEYFYDGANFINQYGEYPFDLSIDRLLSAEPDTTFYTRTGLVMEYDCDNYYYIYNNDGSTPPVAHDYDCSNNGDFLETYDISGNFYYRYEINTRKLFKYVVWW